MPDLISLLPMLAILLVIGAATGVIAGLLGVGGGIVLVPAFFYTFGALGFGGEHLMQVCIGTSAATIVVTSVRSVMLHNRKGAVDWQILRDWAPFLVVGSACGVAVAAMPEHHGPAGGVRRAGGVGGPLHGLWPVQWRLGPAMPQNAAARGAGHRAGAVLDADGHWRRHLRRALDEPLFHAHPPRRGHRLRLRHPDLGALAARAS